MAFQNIKLKHLHHSVPEPTLRVAGGFNVPKDSGRQVLLMPFANLCFPNRIALASSVYCSFSQNSNNVC